MIPFLKYSGRVIMFGSLLPGRLALWAGNFIMSYPDIFSPIGLILAARKALTEH